MVELSIDEAGDAFAARRSVEAGMLRASTLLREAGKPLQSVLKPLRRHVKEEQATIASADVATWTFLLADFHVCLAECLGHRVLCGLLRDLTARTTRVASFYQSIYDARKSCDDHAQIVAALAAGNPEQAAQLMLVHIGDVESGLGKSAALVDPVERLRAPLAPRAGTVTR